jgi:hypothetical protein
MYSETSNELGQLCYNSRNGPFTFADLVAGRRVTNTTPTSDEPVSVTIDKENKQTISEAMTAFPVLTHPRLKLFSSSSMSTVPV